MYVAVEAKPAHPDNLYGLPAVSYYRDPDHKWDGKWDDPYEVQTVMVSKSVRDDYYYTTSHTRYDLRGWVPDASSYWVPMSTDEPREPLPANAAEEQAVALAEQKCCAARHSCNNGSGRRRLRAKAARVE
jgi:hypothetical protein